jgi:diphosphomevalonate decarboxylase
MQSIRELQSQGVGVFFTIDAGPQVKAICAVEDEQTVQQALSATAGVVDVMVSGLGAGAELVTT